VSLHRGRFEIVCTSAGFHVRTIGANGEPLQTSEVLTSRAAAEANVDAVIGVVRDVPAKGVEVRHIDARGGDES
jgi:uncharacterized protein YegP (UPF0339 family)